MAIAKNNTLTDSKYIKQQLEKKYNEKFNDIDLIKSIKNPDKNLSCDGSSFGTIKGKGTTNYYKIYSERNDIEFLVTYNTADESKIIHDTYQDNLNRRNVLLNAHKVIYKHLNNSINQITLVNDNIKINITYEQQLKDSLTTCDEKDIEREIYDSIYINIKDNVYDFSKQNYEKITNLNNEIVILLKNNDYYFNIMLAFNNNEIIELNRLDGKAYIIDKNKIWEGPLDDFIIKET